MLQGALEKHILKHGDESFPEYGAKKLKTEEETLNHIKLEPEINMAEEHGGGGDENDFLDRLLDDLDYPQAGAYSHTQVSGFGLNRQGIYSTR